MTFLLLFGIRLEEGGEVHMHCIRELVHSRTITVHYYSIEVETVENFYKSFYSGEICLLV